MGRIALWAASVARSKPKSATNWAVNVSADLIDTHCFSKGNIGTDGFGSEPVCTLGCEQHGRDLSKGHEEELCGGRDRRTNERARR